MCATHVKCEHGLETPQRRAPPLVCGMGRRCADARHRHNTCSGVCVCVRARVCERARARTHLCVCARVTGSGRAGGSGAPHQLAGTRRAALLGAKRDSPRCFVTICLCSAMCTTSRRPCFVCTGCSCLTHRVMEVVFIDNALLTRCLSTVG